MSALQQHYREVCRRLEACVQNSGRQNGEVALIAVSKTFPVEDIREVYAAGQRDFGENYIQEWYAKTDALADLNDIVWHVIGDVQSNKTKFVAERAHWVHTLCRLKTAQRLSVQRPPHMPPLQACIEVNIAAEAAKHGVPPEEAVALAVQIAALPNIEVRGLMCVAKAGSSENELRKQFQTMQTLLVELNRQGVQADVLSMGMTDDMHIAVECGATHVRIGSAIFGKRHYNTANK